MPLYEVRCQDCDQQYERILPIAERNNPCDKCGGTVDQIYRNAIPQRGFEPYYDEGLGIFATGKGDINQAMRRLGAREREPMSRGDLSARRDKVEALKRQRVSGF
jgi:putative FmdB family regulatory protein